MVAGAEQDVLGLDVAMDEAAGVRGVERVADLRDDAHRSPRIQRPAGAHERAQIRAVDVAHDDEQDALALPGVVDGDDVLVLDRGRRLRLGDEARAEVRALGERRAR